jgi:hypothetical protein
MNCVEFEEFCRKWIDGSWKCQADETQRIVNRTHPYSALHKPKGTPVCARSGERWATRHVSSQL